MKMLCCFNMKHCKTCRSMEPLQPFLDGPDLLLEMKNLVFYMLIIVPQTVLLLWFLTHSGNSEWPGRGFSGLVSLRQRIRGAKRECPQDVSLHAEEMADLSLGFSPLISLHLDARPSFRRSFLLDARVLSRLVSLHDGCMAEFLAALSLLSPFELTQELLCDQPGFLVALSAFVSLRR